MFWGDPTKILMVYIWVKNAIYICQLREGWWGSTRAKITIESNRGSNWFIGMIRWSVEPMYFRRF